MKETGSSTLVADQKRVTGEPALGLLGVEIESAEVHAAKVRATRLQ